MLTRSRCRLGGLTECCEHVSHHSMNHLPLSVSSNHSNRNHLQSFGPRRISVVLSLFCWLYTVQLTKWLWHDKITQLIGLSFVICIEKLCEPNLVLSKICYQQKYNVAVIPKLGITNFKAIHHRDKLADYLSHKMLVCATPHTHLMSVRRLSKNIQAEVLNGWSSFHLGYVLWNALLFRCCTLFQRNVIYPVENEKYLLPHADDQMKEKKTH